jgi:hypothetical protein
MPEDETRSPIEEDHEPQDDQRRSMDRTETNATRALEMKAKVQRLRMVAMAGLALLACTPLRANNIQVTNAAIAGNDNAQGFCFVQFDVTWQNSWRLNGVVNWDAAWVFVKFRTPNGNWQHALLGNTGHTAPAGSQIDVGLLTPGSAFNATTNPVIGTFIRRGTDGTGTFSATGVQLRWNYAQQGIGFNDLTEVRVFGIEMVYVNQGAFFVGSGGGENGSFTDGAWTLGPTIPRQISSEATITIGQTAGNLWGTSNQASNTIGAAGTLAAAYPKGFNAIYCMKYEISQQQYVDFLNTLTREQQNTRTATDLSVGVSSVSNRYVMSNSSGISSRNGIRCNASIDANTPIIIYCDGNANGTGAGATDGQDIACNFLMWNDLTAYLDWSGLRPMTELEFEKACRGPLLPMANEYPWGTSGVAGSAYTYSNTSATNEGIATNYSTTLGNAIYTSTDGAPSGPKRVGIFAANGNNTGRVTAGASYYGIMELGGNLWESAVTVGSTPGRAFTGLLGDGVLATNGNPDVANWPNAGGSGIRGGALNFGAAQVRVSDRANAALFVFSRDESFGGRGCR